MLSQLINNIVLGLKLQTQMYILLCTNHYYLTAQDSNLLYQQILELG